MDVIELEGYSWFEAAQLCYLQRKDETHGKVVLSSWSSGRKNVPWKTTGESLAESVYIGLLVGTWVWHELKSIQTVLKYLKLSTDMSKHFWTLEDNVYNTLLIVEVLEYTDKQKIFKSFHT